MVQDKIVTIPHIGFVIPKLFNDVVEYKVFLFSTLPKTILNCNKYYVPKSSLFILQRFKTQGRAFSNQGSMM